MFAELSLAGRVVGARWPEALGDTGEVLGQDIPDDDQTVGAGLADNVHRAVVERRATPWKRWFNHVDADRDAATAVLIASGRWRLEGRRIIDIDAGSTVTDQQRVLALLAAPEPPADVSDAIIALLVGAAGGAGRPTPRRCRRLAKRWLPPLLMTAGRSGDATLNCVVTGITAIRKAHPVPLLSR